VYTTHMKKVAKKKSTKTTDERLTDLYGVVIDLQTEMRTGFATLERKMLDGFASVREDLSALQAEVRAIRKDLDRLTEQVNGMRGYSKELDTLYARIAIIEKHIGLKTA